MTKLAPEWVRTSDPVIRSPARYRWTTAPAERRMEGQTDGQTDGRMDGQPGNIMSRRSTGRDIKNTIYKYMGPCGERGLNN